jgi:hypothetical protein
MMISTVYGQVQTPSENNSDYSAVVTALGAPYATPTNLPTNNVPIAAAAFMASNGAAVGGPDGTFATAQNMWRGLVQ